MISGAAGGHLDPYLADMPLRHEGFLRGMHVFQREGLRDDRPDFAALDLMISDALSQST